MQVRATVRWHSLRRELTQRFNDKQTQKGIAGRLAGVTEVTIRNRYEEIARELGIEI